ncbi:MAG TPA: hypothetical protein VG222_15660 [Vicinamibacterales bacterium]|nr:hypothetical protein [Vicinamibacterales bacterium]
MNLKRTATFGVVGGAFAAWLAAAATSGVRDAPTPASVRPTQIDSRSAELATEVARLHERLRPTTAPRQPARDLFRFSTPKPKPAPVKASHAALTEAAAAPAPLPPPPFKLSGIAEDAGLEGPIRTAVISGPGQLFLVKEGEMVTPRYRVVRISADVVELLDVGTSLSLRLAMRP